MTDGETEKDYSFDVVRRDSNLIKKLYEDRFATEIIRSFFKQASNTNIKRILELFVKNDIPITLYKISPSHEKLKQNNTIRFDDDGVLKKDIFQQAKTALEKRVKEIIKDYEEFSAPAHPEPNSLLQYKDLIKNVYNLKKSINYVEFRKTVCDEDFSTLFKYDFDAPDMDMISFPENHTMLQRTKIIVQNEGIAFNFPIEFRYLCPECLTEFYKKMYDVVSANGRAKCSGMTVDNDGEEKRCREALSADDDGGKNRNAFYYDLMFPNTTEKNKQSVSAISFLDITPGEYECVLFVLGSYKNRKIYHVVDVKEIESARFILPEKKAGENYIITLVDALDVHIKKQTAFEIWGMYPLKIAMVLQAVFSYCDINLDANIQAVGDASTAKTIILKYYGAMLYGQYYYYTNGESISVPAMRGTREKIPIFGKDINIITLGHLGTYNNIHIDEAGDNEDLIKKLKGFISESDYKYGKTGGGGRGSSNVRIAQINLSQNLNRLHFGKYTKDIKELYKQENIKIGEDEKEAWSNFWDLHLPLYEYKNNPYLYKAIREVREGYARLENKFWVDGFEHALHERFLLYFYLVNKKPMPEGLRDVINRQAINSKKDNILELIKKLYSDDIKDFFISLKEYLPEDDLKTLNKVDDILLKYDIFPDARVRKFYVGMLIKIRMINKRKKFNESDFTILKYIIETTSGKLDIADTNEIVLKGFPDLDEFKKRDETIDNSTKTAEPMFGLTGEEFFG